MDQNGTVVATNHFLSNGLLDNQIVKNWIGLVIKIQQSSYTIIGNNWLFFHMAGVMITKTRLNSCSNLQSLK